MGRVGLLFMSSPMCTAIIGHSTEICVTFCFAQSSPSYLHVIDPDLLDTQPSQQPDFEVKAPRTLLGLPRRAETRVLLISKSMK